MSNTHDSASYKVAIKMSMYHSSLFKESKNYKTTTVVLITVLYMKFECLMF